MKGDYGFAVWVRRRKGDFDIALLVGSNWTFDCMDVFLEYAALPESQGGLLDSIEMHYPSQCGRIINLSQFSSASGSAPRASCTITPKGIFWVASWARLMFGFEFMNLQGLYLADCTQALPGDLEDPQFLQDLVANASHGGTCLQCTLALFAVIARLGHMRREQSRSGSTPRRRITTKTRDICGPCRAVLIVPDVSCAMAFALVSSFSHFVASMFARLFPSRRSFIVAFCDSGTSGSEELLL